MSTATVAPNLLSEAHKTIDAWRESENADRETNVENARRLVHAGLRVECEVVIRLDAELQRSGDITADADRKRAESQIRAHVLSDLRAAQPELAVQLEDASTLATALEVTGTNPARQSQLTSALTECLALHRLYDVRDQTEGACATATKSLSRFRIDAMNMLKERRITHGKAQRRHRVLMDVPDKIKVIVMACPKLVWEGDPPRPSSGLFT